MKFLFTLILLIAPMLTNAKMKAGHNLSVTSDTFKKKDISIGSYAIGYGITDDLLVATSPWLYLAYDMPMIQMKWRFYNGEKFQASIEDSYFKTRSNSTLFTQESHFARLALSSVVTSWLKVHANAGYQYFINDEQPFSLRPDVFDGLENEDKRTISASLLADLQLTDKFGFFLEAGKLGLNYDVPYDHYGASMYFNSDSWHFQFGFSASFREIHDEVRGVIHPEIQVQYLL